MENALPGRNEWEQLIPDEQWTIYKSAIDAISAAKRAFMLGGAFGLAGYTGRCRNTKDLDIYVLPSDGEAVIDALTKAGFEDFYGRLPYDRGWIYRSIQNDIIVDVIWGTPYRLTEVDADWFKHSRPISVKGEKMRIVPPEELVWVKLFVLQRDRCDWPDLLNLLRISGGEIDWDRLLHRVGPDFGLLQALMQVYNWLCPVEALALPARIREVFKLTVPTAEERGLDPRARVALLDSRPWFALFQPADKPMQI